MFIFAIIIELYSKIIKIKKMYPEELITPMKSELEKAGFTSLSTVKEVENAIKKDGTTLVVVNSVCGCAAGTARPGAIASLNFEKAPTNLVTVFAGVDKDATNKAREFMIPFPPSSPSMALFKDGVIVHMLERHHIEGRSADMIAANLIGAYEEFC
jgi:putative YphP/YqiW family bacilliredoxin